MTNSDERQTLVNESDAAYDRAVALSDTPVDRPRKKIAYLEALVAESKLARYDRENPYEVGVDALSSLLDDLIDDDDKESLTTTGVINNVMISGDGNA
jgi:hypothetical protein